MNIWQTCLKKTHHKNKQFMHLTFCPVLSFVWVCGWVVVGGGGGRILWKWQWKFPFLVCCFFSEWNVPKVRTKRPVQEATLHLYILQYTVQLQVWGNGCTHYPLTQQWVKLSVLLRRNVSNDCALNQSQKWCFILFVYSYFCYAELTVLFGGWNSSDPW